MHPIGWLSLPCLVVFFLELSSVVSFEPFFFFCLGASVTLRGRALRVTRGGITLVGCAVTLYVGEGPRGSNGARFTLHRTPIFHSATHNQTGPLWCWFPSGWACAHSRPLWVSPATSPVRLGVSPAAAPTPMGVFTQRFEAFFHHVGALVCMVCFAPHHSSGLSMRECWASGCYPPLCLPRSPPL